MISAKYPDTIISDQYERTDIFFGPMGGTMSNYKKNITYAVFWDLEEAKKYLNDYKDEKYTLEKIMLSKKTVLEIFNNDFDNDIQGDDTEQNETEAAPNRSGNNTQMEDEDIFSKEEQVFVSENKEALPIEQTEQREEELKFASSNKKRFLFIVLGICFVIMPGVIFLIIFQKRKSQSR
jgi:hypothetical protein